MADRIATSGAAAGTSGGSYRKILTYLAKGNGNYVINETNFAGIGVYLPCSAVISLVPGAAGATIQVSSDNGTTWFTLTGVAAATQIGMQLYLDTAATFRIQVITNATDIRFFIQ